MSLGSSASSFVSSAAASDSDGDDIVITSRSRVIISPRRTGRGRSSSRHDHKSSSSRPKAQTATSLSIAASGATSHEREEKSGAIGIVDGGKTGKEYSDRQVESVQSQDSSSTTAVPRRRPTQRKGRHSEHSGSSSSSDAEASPMRRHARRGSSGWAPSRRQVDSNQDTTDAGTKTASHHDTPSSGSLEELKHTLKRLAHQTDRKLSTGSSTEQYHDYIRVMPSLESMGTLLPPEQLRLAEYLNEHKPAKGSHYVSCHSPTTSPRWSDQRPRKSKPVTVDSKRFDSPPTCRTDEETPSLNKGTFAGAAYRSGGGDTGVSAVAGSAQGSRALLSALKALQDKIRRLEEERGSLSQELSDFKAKARKQEAELASKEKKFAYELGQTKESARAAYDAVRMEREELRLEMAKAEEREKAMQSEIGHVRALAQTFSAKADDLGTQLQISEKHCTRLESDMEKSERESERCIRGLKEEIQAVRERFETTQTQLEAVQKKLEDEVASHTSSKERLRESELHDKMVAKVWEATEVANAATKKNKKLMQQQRVSTLARPTAASAANSAGAAAITARRYAEGNSGSSSSARSLPRRPDSSDTTPSKTKKKVTKTKSTSKSTKKTAEPANNMTLLREANLGRDVPFLLGNAASRSFSVIGNVQDAIRQCDTTFVMPSLHETSPVSASKTAKRTKQLDNRELQAPGASASILQNGGEYLRGSGSNTTPRSMRSRPESTTAGFKKNKPGAIKVPAAPRDANPFMSPMQTQIMEDLGAAVEIAEREFNQLNTRYKEIVSQLDGNRTASSEQEGGNHSTAHLSQALGPLLDELEAKSKQVNLLKHVFQTAAGSTINPIRRVVHSPEAVRRKTASLRVLNEYRQLERAARGSAS